MKSEYLNKVISNLWMQEASYMLKPIWVKDDSLDQMKLAASSSNDLLVTERIGELEDGSKNILARIFLNRETQGLECFLLSDQVDVGFTLITFQSKRERLPADANGYIRIPGDIKQQDLLEGFGVTPPRIVIDLHKLDFDSTEMHIAEYNETLFSISMNLDEGILELFTDIDLGDRKIYAFLFPVDKPREGILSNFVNSAAQFQLSLTPIRHYKLAIYE